MASAVIRWPGMLLVGGAGRNSGKTRLTCAILQRFGQRFPLVGIKVTAIQEREGPCPRGEGGCGVCGSIGEDFEISEELDPPPGKDTALMRSCGAARVYWLRVLRRHLARGTAALAQRAGGPGTLCVCESNSLRHAVEPGVFLIVKDRHSRAIKRTSREVMHLADRLVLSDGDGLDLDLDELDIVDGRWTLAGRRRTGSSAP